MFILVGEQSHGNPSPKFHVVDTAVYGRHAATFPSDGGPSMASRSGRGGVLHLEGETGELVREHLFGVIALRRMFDPDTGYTVSMMVFHTKPMREGDRLFAPLPQTIWRTVSATSAELEEVGTPWLWTPEA